MQTVLDLNDREQDSQVEIGLGVRGPVGATHESVSSESLWVLLDFGLAVTSKVWIKMCK